MDVLKVLRANFEAKDKSFLYYLHEENYYHKTAFYELCSCLSTLSHNNTHDKMISTQICFIYGQILRHIIYHFDPSDLIRISNLPINYNEELETLEHAVTKYFSF